MNFYQELGEGGGVLPRGKQEICEYQNHPQVCWKDSNVVSMSFM